MTETELKRVHKRIKSDICICPLCNSDILLTRIDPDTVEYVKTKSGSVNVYHVKCINEYMKGGAVHGM